MPIRRNPCLTHHRRRFSKRPAALRAFRPRSELTSATLGADSYAYAFDDIGNRLTAEELAAETEYASNNLNQYSQIAKEGEAAFSPTYDDDGNQTLVKTSTGIWSVEYNGENRPVKFANGTTVVECKYDSQGRRYEKKVAVDGVTTFWQRYAYRNHLQIAAFDVSVNPDANEEVLTLAATTAWDPAEPLATRPLAFTDHGGDAPATYFYTHDLTKNVCELLDATGAIVAAYDYAPFGAVALSGTSTRNPFQFSSEIHDPETALVYYNYRHYNPLDGRWISRDPLASYNLYSAFDSTPTDNIDVLGLITSSVPIPCTESNLSELYINVIFFAFNSETARQHKARLTSERERTILNAIYETYNALDFLSGAKALWGAPLQKYLIKGAETIAIPHPLEAHIGAMKAAYSAGESILFLQANNSARADLVVQAYRCKCKVDKKKGEKTYFVIVPNFVKHICNFQRR